MHAVRSFNCNILFQGDTENQDIQETSDYNTDQEKHREKYYYCIVSDIPKICHFPSSGRKKRTPIQLKEL